MTSVITRGIAEKRKSWRNYQGTRSQANWEVYKAQRNRLCSLIRCARCAADLALAMDMGVGKKRLFAHIKRHCKVRTKIPIVQRTDGSLASSYGETAELFKGRFLETHRRDNERPEPFCQVAEISHPWLLVHFTTEAVGRLLMNVNPNNSAGPDGIHPAMNNLLALFLCDRHSGSAL